MGLEKLLELGVGGEDGEVGFVLEIAGKGSGRWWSWEVRFGWGGLGGGCVGEVGVGGFVELEAGYRAAG